MIITFGKHEAIGQEAAVNHFKVFFWHSVWWTAEIQEETQIGWMVSGHLRLSEFDREYIYIYTVLMTLYRVLRLSSFEIWLRW